MPLRMNEPGDGKKSERGTFASKYAQYREEIRSVISRLADLAEDKEVCWGWAWSSVIRIMHSSKPPPTRLSLT